MTGQLLLDHSKVLQCHPLEPLRQQAESIVESIFKSRRIIIVTGAGISVSGGIPDFRSFNGLYNLVKRKYPEACVKGKDMFDAHLFNDPLSTKVFYSFMAELKEITESASVTKVHGFIKSMSEKKKLLRCYTQNIDCLEERLGLNCKLLDSKSEVVMLHGSLSHVACTLCKIRIPFDDKHRQAFSQGRPLECAECVEKSSMRVAQNKRSLPVGTMRPDIILYNEHHAAGDWIGEMAAKDMRKRPDMLIVMGTSLKVCGIKKLVKDIARQVRATSKSNSISTVLINKTDIVGSEWKGVFDAKWIGSGDEVVDFIQQGLDSRESGRRKSIVSKISGKCKENIVNLPHLHQTTIEECLEHITTTGSAKNPKKSNNGKQKLKEIKVKQEERDLYCDEVADNLHLNKVKTIQSAELQQKKQEGSPSLISKEISPKKQRITRNRLKVLI